MLNLEEASEAVEVVASKVVAANALAEEAVAVVVVDLHQNKKNHLKIITNYSVFQETQMMPLSRKSSRNWLSSIILIKIKTILRQPRKSSRRLLSLMKLCKIPTKDEHMIWVVKKVLGSKRPEEDRVCIWTWMIYFHNSLEVVVLVVDAAVDSISSKVQVDLAEASETKVVEDEDNKKLFIYS